MATTTFIVNYFNRKLQKYVPVAEVRFGWKGCLEFDQQLEEIFGIFNGQAPCDQAQAQVKYYYNPQSLRSMSVGDAIEVHGLGSITRWYGCRNQGFEEVLED